MTLRLGSIRIKVHPALLVWLLLSICLGRADTALAAFSALFMHEIGHIIPVRCIHLHVSSLEITPFGAVMRIDGIESASCGQSMLIAAGGPIVSLLCCLLSPLLLRLSLVPYGFIQRFARFDLLLFVVNLLPALPLDGGRMLQALLGRFFPHHTVTRTLFWAGYAAGMALCAISVFGALRGELILPPAFAGLYLLYAAAISRRQSGLFFVSSLISRRNRLDSTIPLSVELLAARADMPLRALLPHLHPGKYHLILLLPPSGVGLLGMVTDLQLSDALMRSTDLRLSDCEIEAFPYKNRTASNRPANAV